MTLPPAGTTIVRALIVRVGNVPMASSSSKTYSEAAMVLFRSFNTIEIMWLKSGSSYGVGRGSDSILETRSR